METAPTARRARFSALEYRDPAPQPWLIHALGVVNRAWFLPGVLRLSRFDLPAADLARLREAVNPRTAAFLGPAHPEFLTDWMVDKEVSRRCSPLMAHWASYEIVNGTPVTRAFWLANNLIANVPGGGGKEYSVRWARRGHGVLLHPEGTATWQGERVSTLLPGLVDMACEAARLANDAGERRPVWLVPLVWRLTFLRDPRRALVREIAHIERALGLPGTREAALEARLGALLVQLLARQCERLRLTPPAGAPEPRRYFAAQAQVLAALRDSLAERYGILDGDLTRAQFQLRKAMRERTATDPEGVRADRARLAELQRLASLDPALYDRPRLASERVAEILKRTRSALVTRGFANAVHNVVPVGVAPREVHVRVPDPIPVSGHESGAERARLLETHRARLQSGLDALGGELAAREQRFALANPVWSGSAA